MKSKLDVYRKLYRPVYVPVNPLNGKRTLSSITVSTSRFSQTMASMLTLILKRLLRTRYLIDEDIKEFAGRHKKWLHQHTTVELILLLNAVQKHLRHLKRHKPCDLV